MQAEHGKWRKFIGAKQNWPTVQKFSLVSFWYFSQSLILSQLLKLRRCHDSALGEHFILAHDFVHFSPTNSLTVPSNVTNLVILNREDQKRPISLQLLTFPAMHDFNREERKSKCSIDLIKDASQSLFLGWARVLLFLPVMAPSCNFGLHRKHQF